MSLSGKETVTWCGGIAQGPAGRHGGRWIGGRWHDLVDDVTHPERPELAAASSVGEPRTW